MPFCASRLKAESGVFWRPCCGNGLALSWPASFPAGASKRSPTASAENACALVAHSTTGMQTTLPRLLAMHCRRQHTRTARRWVAGASPARAAVIKAAALLLLRSPAAAVGSKCRSVSMHARVVRACFASVALAKVHVVGSHPTPSVMNASSAVRVPPGIRAAPLHMPECCTKVVSKDSFSAARARAPHRR